MWSRLNAVFLDMFFEAHQRPSPAQQTRAAQLCLGTASNLEDRFDSTIQAMRLLCGIVVQRLFLKTVAFRAGGRGSPGAIIV